MARSLIALLVAGMSAARRKRLARSKRLRPILPSHAAELQYLGGLASIVEECKKAGDDILAALRPTWPGVHDAAAPSHAHLLEQAAHRLTQIVGARADLLANLAARKAREGADAALVKAIHQAIGVDISGYLGADTEIGAAMKAAVAENVALIKSIPTEYLAKVGKAIESYFKGGKTWEALAHEVERIGSVTYTRARLIARDQASKMNAAFNEVRQTAIGITHYVWSTSRDERVRPAHRELNGTTQAWAKPPLVEGEHVHPGEAINCRCAAIPVVDLRALTAEPEKEAA